MKKPLSISSILLALALSVVAFPVSSATVSAGVATPKLEAAWARYLQTLDEMRRQLEASPRFRDNPEDRAKAFHALMEMQAMAYNFAIQPRLYRPRLFRNLTWATNVYALGQTGPDTDYRNAFLEGSQVYKITGTVGNTKLINIQVFNGLFGDPAFKSVANYDLKDMDVAEDGSFEVIVGGPPRARNWIPLDPDVRYGFVLIRRIQTDWTKDIGEMKIDRISSPKDAIFQAEEFDEADMADRIDRAIQLVRFLNGQFNLALYDNYVKGAGGQINRFSKRPAQTDNQLGNDSSRYAALAFKLQDDEALLVTMPKAPQGVYWSFHSGDVWSRSLDFFERQSSINNDQAQIGTDGSLTLIVGATDPGIRNWVDTVHRKNGVLFMRNYRANEDPEISTRVIKIKDISDYIPKEMDRVTSEQRAILLNQRRESYLSVYGE